MTPEEQILADAVVKVWLSGVVHRTCVQFTLEAIDYPQLVMRVKELEDTVELWKDEHRKLKQRSDLLDEVQTFMEWFTELCEHGDHDDPRCGMCEWEDLLSRISATKEER